MRILRIGSVGPSVELLQLALRRAGYGALSTDGVFGPLTRSALMRFQTDRGLTADGVAGGVTHRWLLPYYTGYLVKTVRSGDSFYRLAEEYGATPEAVALANPGLEPRRLMPGSSVVIPLPFPVAPTDISWCSALVGYCVRGLAARYPFVSVADIGKSVMGKPLLSLSLGRGANRVMYNAVHHANEWICAPLLLKFAEELCEAFASGGTLYSVSAAEILDYATIFLVPAVDPDGMDLATGELQGGDYYKAALRIAGDYPRFAFPQGWKANIRGVDLNLQYPAGWEQARINKRAQGVDSPAPADFVGPAPLSAPESRAMYDYTLSVSPALTLSYHTQGQVIYWKYQDRRPPGAEEIAQALQAASGYALEETPYLSGFAGYKDWFIQAFDRPGYTIEAGLGENPLPISDFGEIYERNLGILTLSALMT